MGEKYDAFGGSSEVDRSEMLKKLAVPFSMTVKKRHRDLAYFSQSRTGISSLPNRPYLALLSIIPFYLLLPIGPERPWPPLRQPADERRCSIRGHSGYRVHTLQGQRTQHVHDSSLCSHGYISELHS